MYTLHKRDNGEYFILNRYREPEATTGKPGGWPEKKLDKKQVEEMIKGIDPVQQALLNGRIIEEPCWGVEIEYEQINTNKNKPWEDPRMVTIPKKVNGFIVIKKIIKPSQATPEQVASYKKNRMLDSDDRLREEKQNVNRFRDSK
jgi:hypothetical protein